MSWREQLMAASFRGVPFEATADDMTAGRRLQVYDYPMRDVPYVADLGRATREISVTAFVIGADYMTRRDALLAAIEAAGSGTLVHPWYGRLTVSVKDCRVSHSNQEGGLCRFNLTFVEGGALTFPTSTPATAAQVSIASAAVTTAGKADAAAGISVANQPAHVVDAAMASAKAALAVVQGAWGVVSPTGIINQVQTLLRTPAELAQGVADLFVGVTTADYGALLAGAFGVLDLMPGLPVHRSTADASATPAMVATTANTAELQTLVRMQLVVLASNTLAAMPSLPVLDDAQQLRDRICAAIDAEAATATDASFAVLADLRTAVITDVATRARDSARLMTVTPRAVMPAAVLAYDLYSDATRADEICARNRVHDPLFLPALPLQVLSR